MYTVFCTTKNRHDKHRLQFCPKFTGNSINIYNMSTWFSQLVDIDVLIYNSWMCQTLLIHLYCINIIIGFSLEKRLSVSISEWVVILIIPKIGNKQLNKKCSESILDYCCFSHFVMVEYLEMLLNKGLSA